MNTVIHYGFVLLILMQATIAIAQPSLPDTTRQHIRTTIAGLKERFRSPSMIVAIVYKDQIIFEEAVGFSNQERQIPATMDSKYPVLSITKLFTATALMQLEQEGRVRLDDEVRKYLPQFKVKSASGDDAGTTLFQLATHSSGLPRNSPADIRFSESIDRWLLTGGKTSVTWPATETAVLASLKNIKIQYPPYHYVSYSDRHYSNLGYSVLGIALEHPAGKKLTAYISEKIFKPLSMNRSGFLTDPINTDSIAIGSWYNAATNTMVPVPLWQPGGADYAGGMYTTARDVAKFISFQFDGKNKLYQKILSVENRAMMHYLKIGWKPEFPYVLHEGSMLGFRSIIVVQPDLKFGWVVLTNTSDFNFSPLNRRFDELLTPVFSRKPITELQKFAGDYELEGGKGKISFYVKNDSLYSSYLSVELGTKPLLNTGVHRFTAKGPGSHNLNFEFVVNESGEVVGLNYGQMIWYKKAE